MLNVKMFRDIKKNKSQFITIFLMIMIGVMAYSGIDAYMSGMKVTADKFYLENNLEDINIYGTSLTLNDLDKIKEIDNVLEAEVKLSVTATTDNDKTLLLSFIDSNKISKFYVYDGKKFDSDLSGVWLDYYYALENDIKVGDTILVKYDSLELNEEVLGLIQVPDHLYDVRDESELYPNHSEFGFAYLSVNELINNSLADKDSLIFSTIMVDVDEKDNVLNVINDIESLKLNLLSIEKIEDNISYVTYQGEIDEGKTYIGVFSGLFLFIAMLSVITTMTRVVKNQRKQIGTLKALGFNNMKILFHYMGYGIWISIISCIVGLILGYFFIGKFFVSLEMDFFEIPNGHPVMNSSSYIVSIIVIMLVGAITYITGRSILRENPADTLRNKVPSVKRKSLNITTKGIFKKLSFSSVWNIRDMFRNKFRTVMGIVGVVGCSMLIVCALGMLDSMNYFVELQFDKLYNFDYKLKLGNEINDNELENLINKYGDNTSKTYTIEILDGDKKEINTLFVTDANDYVRFVNDKGKFIKLDSNDGVYVTYKLAKNNNYKIGDKIRWHIYGSDLEYTSKIIGFNKDPQLQNITITRSYLESLDSNDGNKLKYIPDTIYTNNDLKKVKEINNVNSIQDISELKDGMNEMLSMMKTMLVLIISIAVILGSIIIYNLGILSFTEKEYQFATLKVLGFKDKQIKNIFIKQNNIIAIISIIIGLPLGYYLTDWLFKTAIEEHYDFGASIEIRTYFISAISTFVISYLVSKFLSCKIKKIDMVTSLKGNE